MQPTAHAGNRSVEPAYFILSVAACAAVPELNSHDGQNGQQNLKWLLYESLCKMSATPGLVRQPVSVGEIIVILPLSFQNWSYSTEAKKGKG